MPWQWYDSTVIKIENATPTTKRFWVKLEQEEAMSFKAGQFVTMDLPIHEKRLKRWRSYSIANAPDGTNILEFVIVKLENGAGTTYLFEEVEVGTKIRFKGPDGAFCIPDGPIEKDLVLVATGTGVAPFRAYLWDIYNKKIAHQKIHLIFGTRNKSGILYREEFENFKTLLPGFEYTVALSQDKTWDGPQGYVHQVYLNKYKDKKDDIKFYLCGWTKMIDEAVANLIVTLKYDRKQVIYELYG